MKKLSAAILSGALAGAANGFFGSGGGMILVPAFIRFFGMEEKKAFATSLAVILPISAVSAGVFLKRGGFDIMNALPFILGGSLGGMVSNRFFKKIPAKWLRASLLVFMIYGGLRLMLSK